MPRRAAKTRIVARIDGVDKEIMALRKQGQMRLLERDGLNHEGSNGDRRTVDRHISIHYAADSNEVTIMRTVITDDGTKTSQSSRLIRNGPEPFVNVLHARVCQDFSDSKYDASPSAKDSVFRIKDHTRYSTLVYSIALATADFRLVGLDLDQINVIRLGFDDLEIIIFYWFLPVEASSFSGTVALTTSLPRIDDGEIVQLATGERFLLNGSHEQFYETVDLVVHQASESHGRRLLKLFAKERYLEPDFVTFFLELMGSLNYNPLTGSELVENAKEGASKDVSVFP